MKPIFCVICNKRLKGIRRKYCSNKCYQKGIHIFMKDYYKKKKRKNYFFEFNEQNPQLCIVCKKPIIKRKLKGIKTCNQKCAGILAYKIRRKNVKKKK